MKLLWCKFTSSSHGNIIYRSTYISTKVIPGCDSALMDRTSSDALKQVAPKRQSLQLQCTTRTTTATPKAIKSINWCAQIKFEWPPLAFESPHVTHGSSSENINNRDRPVSYENLLLYINIWLTHIDRHKDYWFLSWKQSSCSMWTYYKKLHRNMRKTYCELVFSETTIFRK